ncbi:MAG: cytochrome c oxidase subunit II, partial [Dehalococcoidia bacterium]
AMPLMPDISTHGFWIDWTIITITIVTVLVAVLTFGLIIAALINFRQKNNPTATAHLSGWITRLVVLDFVMIFFDIVIAVVSTSGWAQTILVGEEELIREHGKPAHVQVVGRQFFWSFGYPGADDNFDTADDFTLANELVVQQGQLVILTVTSGDVIHSFFAPNLRVKYDAIPGRETRVWFVPQETGEYSVLCTELCGLGHYQMLATIRVLPTEEYQGWLQTKSVNLGDLDGDYIATAPPY